GWPGPAMAPPRPRSRPPACPAVFPAAPGRHLRENSRGAPRSDRLKLFPPVASSQNGLAGGRTREMKKPVVGVIGNSHRVENRFQVQMVGERNLRAVAEVCGGLPLMFAGSADITDIGALLDVVDGIVLTGARANVHPTRFNVDPCEKHEPYDIHRDEVALALSLACVARGIPLFGICPGLQEMLVAFGGSLPPEIRELPARMTHRMPRLENGEIHPDPTVVFADRHEVDLTPGGAFAKILGCEKIKVNSLHGQGI